MPQSPTPSLPSAAAVRPRLRLRWLPPLVGVLLIAAFLQLGRWQLHRAEEKRSILAAAAEAPALHWGDWEQQPPRYARLLLRGHFDSERHVLLDNQVLDGRPGVHVWTPFQVEQGDWLLVNRGWLPLSPERDWPSISTPTQALEIQVQVNQAPRVGLRLGQPQALASQHWPQLTTYLEPRLIAEATQLALPDWIGQLDAASPGGFAGRHWAVVNFGPEKHLSYAWTWFSLAFTVAVVTALLQWRSHRARAGQDPKQPAHFADKRTQP